MSWSSISATAWRRSSFVTAGRRRLLEWQRAIGGAEIAINLRRNGRTVATGFSAALRARIEHGRAVRALDYPSALGRVPAAQREPDRALPSSGYDAILTPAALGTAPKGLESTGDPAILRAVDALRDAGAQRPADAGASGLPLGAQLVGARHRDGPASAERRAGSWPTFERRVARRAPPRLERHLIAMRRLANAAR